MTEPMFNIVWDDNKALNNLNKHGVSFQQAATVMFDPLALTVFDAIHSEVEERWFTLGIDSERQLLAVAHTYQFIDNNSIQVRLISARPATRREQKTYENTQPYR